MRNILAGLLLLAGGSFYKLGTLSASIPRWTVIYSAAAIAVAAFLLNLFRTGRIRIGPLDLAMLLFVGYAAETLLWTPDWRQGLIDWTHLAVLAAVFFYVRHGRVDATWVGPAMVAVALAMLWWAPADTGGHGNPNFATEYLLLALPFAVSRWWGWPTAGAAVVYLLFGNESKLEFLVFAVWAAAWAIRFGLPAWAAAVGGAGGIGVLMAAATDSVWARAELYYNTAVMVLDAPVVGHGIGSFNYVYSLFREAHLDRFPEWGTIMSLPQNFAGAAHNEPLQLLAEMGLVGFVLAGAVLWLALRRAEPGPALWVLLTAAPLALVEFPLQNPATAFLATVALGMAGRNDPVRSHGVAVPLRGLLAGFCAVAVVLGGYGAFRQYRAWVDFAVTTAALEMGTYPALALQKNLSAYDWMPLDRAIREQMIVTLAKVLQTYRERVELDAKTADRIYGIAMSAGPSPPVLLSRAEYLVNSGRVQERFAELVWLVERLKRESRSHAHAWVADAYLAASLGDVDRLKQDIARARKTRNLDPEMAAQLDKFSALLEEQE